MISRHSMGIGWYQREVRKRWRTIVIPYFSWCFIWFLVLAPFSVWANLVTHRPLGTNIPLIHSPLVALGFSVAEPVNRPLWYLRSLMILVVLTPILKMAIDRLKWGWIVLVFVGDCLVWQFCPLYAKTVKYFFPLSSILYFSLGLMLHRRGIPVANLKLGLGAFCTGVVSLMIGGEGHIAILTLLYFLWTVIPKRRLPSFVLSATFLIYAAHMIVVSIGDIALRNLSFVGGHLVVWIVSILILLVVHTIWNRYSPGTYSFLTGGRSSR